MKDAIELTTHIGRLTIKVSEITSIKDYKPIGTFVSHRNDCDIVNEDYDTVIKMIGNTEDQFQIFNNFQIISDPKDAKPEEYGMIFLHPNYEPERDKKEFDKAITKLFSDFNLIPFGYNNGKLNLSRKDLAWHFYTRCEQDYHYSININPMRYDYTTMDLYLFGSKTTYEDYRYSELLAIFNILHLHLVEKQDLEQTLIRFKNCGYIKDFCVDDGDNIHIRTFDSPCLTYRPLNINNLSQMYNDMKKLFVKNHNINLKSSETNAYSVINRMLDYLTSRHVAILGGVFHITLDEFRIKMNSLFNTNVLPSHEINDACDIWVTAIYKERNQNESTNV